MAMPLAGWTYPVGLGFATVLPEFDFETYSEAGYEFDYQAWKWRSLEGIAKTKRGLSVVGAYNYVSHPSFRVISLSYNLKDGTGAKFWRPGLPLPVDLFEHVKARKLLEAWNVGFEFWVWSLYCAPKLGWPRIDTMSLRCAMAKAAASSRPQALDKASEVLKLVNKKDPAGADLIRKLTVPRNPTKKNPMLFWTPDTAPDDFRRFYEYNVQDIVAEAEASSKLPDLSPRELRIWQMDQTVNHRGIPVDRVAMENCIAIVEQATDKYNSELYQITHGAVDKSSEVAKTIAWMQAQGVYLNELDEETVEAELLRPHAPNIKRVLEIRQRLAFGSVKKLFAMRHQVSADGRLRDQYVYHGAHTSLWNGRAVQPANFYKGKLDKPEKIEAALAVIASRSLEYVESVYGDAMECVADCLRSIFKAPEGSRFITSDYNAIQAVVTSALAGEEWRMQIFRTHGKIYEAMAAALTGNTLEFYLDYRKKHGKHHDDRQLGKLAVLSADFGAWISGWKRFGAEKYGDDQFIKQLILKTRAAIPHVVEFWGGQTRNKWKSDMRPELYGLEGAAIKAVLQPGECFGYRGVRYQVHGNVLYCKPPGPGEPLQYHNPQLNKSRREWAEPWELDLSYEGWNSNQTKGKGGWVRMPLYGGVLTQNAVAKVSREFQADALVSLEDCGYPVTLHTHDEQGTVLPWGVGSGDQQLRIVNATKPWAVDDEGRPWPVKAASADETERYGKWE